MYVLILVLLIKEFQLSAGVDEGMDENSNNDLDQNQCLEYLYDLEMIQEIEPRIILHWNYRNLREIPREVLEYGAHLKEMYLKRNLIQNLVRIKRKSLTVFVRRNRSNLGLSLKLLRCKCMHSAH